MSSRRWFGPARIALVALAAAAPGLHAHQGVAIDAARIGLGELAPGRSYALRPLVVRNPGSEAGRYELTLDFFDGTGALRPNPRWIRFDVKSFDLAPRARRTVPIELVLPADAAPGDYQALLVVTLMPRGKAFVGAGTASRLSFTVTAPVAATAEREVQ